MMLRRDLLALAAAPLGSAAAGTVKMHASTYAMQTLDVDTAVEHLRTIGYDGAELCLMRGWPSEPAKFDATARRRIRATGFPIPTLIENFSTLVDDAAHAKTLDRIRDAAALAYDIAP